MNWQTEGYTEVGIGTRSLTPWLEVFEDLGCWRTLWQGVPGPKHNVHWPGPVKPLQEVLLASEDAHFGRVRLFEYAEEENLPCPRRSAHCWDTGGIYDIDVRVRDVFEVRQELLNRGWSEISEPIDWPFGELRVREWLARGPDGVIVAFVQRLHPALATGTPGPGFGPAFNSTQAVRDVDASMAFYRTLGFQTMVDHRAALGGRGGEVVGLSPERAPKVSVHLLIAHPASCFEGSLELVAIPEEPGLDLSEDMTPAMLGLNLLRFPVHGLPSFHQFLESSGLRPSPMRPMTLAPAAPVNSFSLRSPDGAWLEFFETF